MDLPKHPSILLVGEALVDFISTENSTSLADARSFTKYAGGSVANLAANLAKLGFNAYLGACLGKDGFGDFLTKELEAAGVRLDLLQTTGLAPTTIVQVSRNTATPDFSIYRGADAWLQISEGLSAFAREAYLLHTSAFALSREPARSTIQTLLRTSKQAGKLVSLDPNYHPLIWPDIPDFLEELKGMISLASVVKPSLDDSRRIFGPGLPPDQYLEMFLDLGPEIVLLTMGNQGTMLGTADGQRYQILPNQVDPVDVTGAGDAFWSGVITGFLNQLTPLESARLGQVVAEHKISLVGPIPQFHTIEQYLELASRTAFKKLL